MLLNIQSNVMSLLMLIYFGFQKGICGNMPQTLKLLMSLTDKNFTDNVIWIMVTKNVGMCGHQCYKDDRCRWIAYNYIDNTCQGHSVTYTKQSEGAFHSSPGTKNYLPSGKKMSLSGVLVSASSEYRYAWHPTGPSLAIDEDLNTFFHSGYETTTFPYLLLKWNTGITVTKLIVGKRAGAEFRFEDVYVFVGYGSEDLNLCNKLLAPTSDNNAQFTCPYPMRGDVIKIEHRGPLRSYPSYGLENIRILEVVEVEVYGY